MKQRATNSKHATTWTVTAKAASAESGRLPADRLRRLLANQIASQIASSLTPELPGVNGGLGSGVDASAKGGK